MILDIIIPAYNVNKYIKQCLDSIINIPDVNILLINDGSKEDLSFIKNDYSKYKNFYYYEKENGGLSSARNYGINKATSDYIMFLDGDDYIETKELKKVIESLKLFKDKVFFYYFRYYWEKQDKFKEETMLDFYEKEIGQIEDIVGSRNHFLMVAWRYIIDRKFILDNNLFFKEGIVHEDEEWTTRLWCFAEKIRILKYFIYNYRQREGSISSKYTVKHLVDLFQIVNYLDEFSLSLDDRKKLQLIEAKKIEIFKISCIRSLNMIFTRTEREQYELLYEDVIKKVNFNNKIINRLPYSIMRILLKIRIIIKKYI